MDIVIDGKGYGSIPRHQGRVHTYKQVIIYDTKGDGRIIRQLQAGA